VIPATQSSANSRESSAPTPKTLFQKIWDEHVVVDEPGAPTVLAIDLHLIHEVTSPQAFTGLRARGLRVRRPEQTVATADHSVPTHDRSLPILDEMAAAQVRQLEDNCAEFGIPLHGIGSPAQGIVHVIGPQLGLTQPGMTIVCGDSHTSTHGAFGALAFGIGTSEVEMVLASQCLLQRRPKTYEVRVNGRLTAGVSAKDVILALIARIGVGGGTGHVFEYSGEAIRALTLDPTCNLQSIWSGYTGPGGKTITPAEAHARLDLRLVPDQDPDEIIAAVRGHLADQGFGDIEVRPFSFQYRAYWTPPDHPILAAAIRVSEEVLGKPAIHDLSTAGTAPMHVVCAAGNVPVTTLGGSDDECRAHAPDESFRLDYAAAAVRITGRFFDAFAALGD